MLAQQYEDKFVAVQKNKNFANVWDMQSGKHLVHTSFKIAEKIDQFENSDAANSSFEVFKSKKELEEEP